MRGVSDTSRQSAGDTAILSHCLLRPEDAHVPPSGLHQAYTDCDSGRRVRCVCVFGGGGGVLWFVNPKGIDESTGVASI